MLQRLFWFYFRNWGKNARLTLTKLSTKFTNITKFLKQNQGIPNEILFAVKPNLLRFCHKICWTKLKRFYKVCHYKVKIINFKMWNNQNSKKSPSYYLNRKWNVWEIMYRGSSPNAHGKSNLCKIWIRSNRSLVYFYHSLSTVLNTLHLFI